MSNFFFLFYPQNDIRYFQKFQISTECNKNINFTKMCFFDFEKHLRREILQKCHKTFTSIVKKKKDKDGTREKQVLGDLVCNENIFTFKLNYELSSVFQNRNSIVTYQHKNLGIKLILFRKFSGKSETRCNNLTLLYWLKHIHY